MATAMAHMPSTPGAGPSSNPISRVASTSSHMPSNQSVADDEEEWLAPFRDELRRNQEKQQAEMLQQAEDEYRRASNQLAVRYARAHAPDGLSDAAYEAAKAKLDRAFEGRKDKIRRILQDEEMALIQHERGIRKLSLGGQLESAEAEALIREQEELYKIYQAQKRSDSANVDNHQAALPPSVTPQRATWVPPPRSMSSQKSNTSTAPSIGQGRRESVTMPQQTSKLAEDLFPKRTPYQSRNARYPSWEDDSYFPSAPELHEGPEQMSDSDSDNERERDGDDADEDSVSGEDDDNANDGLDFFSDFMLRTERTCSDVPVKTAPLNIARSGIHQPSPRGRSRVTGRTPPSTTMSYSTNTTPLRQQSQNQGLSRNNSDAQHKLWKPSRENMRLPPLTRRPSVSEAAFREQERIREAERPWIEHESARARYPAGVASGGPGTSASPPTQGLVAFSFGASSAAAFAQTQRSTDGSARIWKPPENKASMPATSNVHVMASPSGSSNSPAPPTSLNSNATPAANTPSYRRRNDSDTSAGSPVRRPSQYQTQSFTQHVPSPKASLPISTPGISNSRRSPIPGSDSYASNPSPPIHTPPSASSARRAPYAARPPSPSFMAPPVNRVGASGASLSRQPTEITDTAPTSRESKTNTFLPRVSAKSRAADDSSELEPSTSSGSGFSGERTRSFPSNSALSEQMARERNRDAEQKYKEREEAIRLQSEELRLRDEQQRKREAELSARTSIYDSEPAEQRQRSLEGQRKLREDGLEERRAAQERTTRERDELVTAQRAREAEFSEQKRVLEAQRQREADLRMQKERELATKEEELNMHKREMEERLRLREEREIAEQTRQLELLKKKEAALEEQQRMLEAQRQLELEEQRRKEDELQQKLEDLKRQQRELAEAQRRKEEREREEALMRQQEEALLAEQRRKEDELRAQEDELKQKAWALHQREEALARRRKEEELRQKEEALERQRRELQQREEELARREEEDERRRSEERARKEREMTLRRQQEEEDKKRLEGHMLRKLAQEREREGEERETRERQLREREERERERKEKEALKERDRRMQRGWEQDRRRQEDYDQRAKDTERRKKEEEDERVAAEIKQQEELLHYYEQRKRGTTSSSSFSSSIPNPASSFSSASGAFHSGRATSSASSIHSTWSQRSSASSASSAASDFSRASTGSSASSAWSSTRPTSASTGSSGSNRTATGESHKPAPGAWKPASAAGSGTGPSPSGPGMGSYTNTSPLSEAEWRRRQEENARRQQEQFRRDSLRSEQERTAQAAAAAMASSGGRDQLQRAWASYESAWASLKDRPVLYFRSMPWPVLRPPSTPEDLTTNAIGAFVLSPAHSTDKGARDRLKEQLLRWHPDRFESKWLSKVDAADKEIVGHAAGQVVRGLNELMARESNDPFG